MKKTIILLLLSLHLCNVFAQKKTVAVYVMGAENIEETTKQIVGSELVAGIVANEEYSAVERTADFLSELSKEHNYQRSGSVDDQQIRELGKQFGVGQVCVANIMPYQSSFYIQARMLDVETATVLATAREVSSLSTLEDIVSAAEKLAIKLVGKKEKVPQTFFKEISTVLTQNEDNCGIMAIDNTGSATLVYFKYLAKQKMSIRISPDAYILDKTTSKHYKITGANGISTTNYTPVEKGITEFVVYFEKMPTTVSKIDIVEPESNGWKWQNITLRPYDQADYFVFSDEIQQKYTDWITKETAREHEIKENATNTANAIVDLINTINSYTLIVYNYKNSPYKIHFGKNILGVVGGKSKRVFTVPMSLNGVLTATQNSGYLLFPTTYTYTIPIQKKHATVTIYIK